MLMIDHSALLTHSFPDELFLVDPVMPMGGIVLLHGKRGLGKTQLALTLICDIIHGLPFLGCLETQQGRVAYIQADMPPQLQQQRAQHLAMYPLPGLRWYISREQIDILDPNERTVAALEDIRTRDPVLVVIDTLRRSHKLDENSSDTPVAVYGAWREGVGPKPTLLFLHHDRKTSFDGPSDRDEEFRGSGAWLDEADLGMHICKTKGGLVMEWSKSRTFDPKEVGESFNLQMSTETLLLSATNPIEGPLRDAMKRGLPREQIINMLQDKGRFGRYALSRATAYRRVADYHPQRKAA